MKSQEIRNRYLNFFKENAHAIIPSASLIPENDPSVLFNTAGMQPLVPYLLGQKHPLGTRLANIQKCVRTGDIDDIGDNTHGTFFEMMGNWSLGDYFKKEAIEWSYALLTDKEKGFGLDPQRLYVTCFEGDSNAPKDTQSAEIWKNIFQKNNVTGERIYFMPAKNNWWSPGDNGPCGPDTEMFFDVTGDLTNGMTKEEYLLADDKQQVVEIWNDVFMEYEKKDGKVIGKLSKQNVDTGSGFERVTMVLQGKNNIFDTDIFSPIMQVTRKLASNEKSARIIADHLRTSVFMIADGARPSNTDQGYILRRLIRRAVFNTDSKSLSNDEVKSLVFAVVSYYKNVYPEMEKNSDEIIKVITDEAKKFAKTILQGMKRFENVIKTYVGDRLSHKERIDMLESAPWELPGNEIFSLVTSYGFPLELIKEIAKNRNMILDIKGFEEEFKKHQDLSRVGAEKKFKGGLAGTGEMETKYHTATHLLNAALHKVLGNHIMQKGSNITAERLRFDFSHGEKMTDEQKLEVEKIVNEAIQKNYPVSWSEMPIEKARELGAIGVFGDKYGEIVKVYSVGDEVTGVFSRELCGGPHVENTGTLGVFKIQKEEAVSAGVRRIKAVLM